MSDTDYIEKCHAECKGHDKIVPRWLCQTFEGPGRPEGKKQRSIFFPANAARPKFVWVPVYHRNREREDVFVTADQAEQQEDFPPSDQWTPRDPDRLRQRDL